ncbi:hypothetical protein [Devosia sp. SL43]|uniref:hypothetical protein n=1 Tax=Devosia sp. SL43 TaxID=2806348 RepID=UPI001F311F6F|nr:hypothetical protein [Devosia sp. SL43]UJW87934.1 hypothetical protein IM737_20850 [Devosia sp. SL43]
MSSETRVSDELSGGKKTPGEVVFELEREAAALSIEGERRGADDAEMFDATAMLLVKASVMIKSLERRTLETPPLAAQDGALTAVQKLAVSMTDEKIANALDEECETILQLIIHDQPHQVAEHVGALKSWSGMLRGRASRMPATPPSQAIDAGYGEAVAWEGYWPGAGSINSQTSLTRFRSTMEKWEKDGAEITPLYYTHPAAGRVSVSDDRGNQPQTPAAQGSAPVEGLNANQLLDIVRSIENNPPDLWGGVVGDPGRAHYDTGWFAACHAIRASLSSLGGGE